MILRLMTTVFVLGALCFADTITLKNGGVIQGTYLGGDSRHVKVAVGDRIDTYSVDELANIRFGGNAPPPAERSYTRGPDGLERRSEATSQQPRYETPTPSYGVLIPAGTALVVRLIDPVDSGAVT